MKVSRLELTKLRNMAFLASEGNQAAMQWLYPQYGSLNRDEARGIGIAIGTWLINMDKED